MSELDCFRSEWLHELKREQHTVQNPTENRRHVVGGPRASETNRDLRGKTSEETGRLARDGANGTKQAGKRRLVQLEPNLHRLEQPRAFDIADRLLQGEILTDDDLFESKKRASRSRTAPVECSDEPPLSSCKPPLADCASLVDTFINDLNEIDEIPFFDICLPREVAINIFKHLDIVDLCRCAQVSRSWKSIADDELLWHRHSCRMGFADEMVALEKSNWKDYLREQVQKEARLRHNWKNRIGRLYDLEYARAGVLSAVDSSDDFILAGYSSGDVRLWQRNSSGVQLLDALLDEAVCSNSSSYVSSVALAKGCAVVGYAEGEVCVAGLGSQGSSAAAFRPAITLPGPARVAASRQDGHFAAFGGTSVALVDPRGWVQSVQLPTKVSDVVLLPTAHSRRWPPVVSAAEDAVRLHAGEQFQADGLPLHHLIGATVTCLDACETVIALGLTDRSAVNVFQVPLYSAESGQLRGTLTNHSSCVLCVNISQCPDNLVLTGSCDKNARIFDLRTLRCEVRINAHGLGVTRVQMDEHSLVTGGQDGLVCVWDLRTKAKLWEMFCRHPVQHLRANPTTLVTAHIPRDLFPEPEDGSIVVHTRQRGSIRIYDFSANQQTSGIPSICLSSYDEPAGYNYNVRLAVPYDDIMDA
uniref:Putative wd40 domain protein n=1 Tax=Amblyomma sculptum TaxID=1581419 RepID=A0A1E1XKZ9_AMBSC